MLSLSLIAAAVGFGWLSILAVILTVPAGIWVYREYGLSLRHAATGPIHPELDAFAALVGGMAALSAGPLCIVLVAVLRVLR